ncbi:MAG: hypothetical protein ACFCUQ_16310 [Kiloniellales bacterium]
MSATAAKARLLLRAELLRGRIAARSLAVRAAIYAAAAFVALLGVVLLVMAAYLALAAELGPVIAALLTGAGLCGLALLLALAAAPLSRGRSAAAADQLERAIRAELQQDLQAVETRIRQIEQGFTGLGFGPLALLAFGLGLAAAVSPRLRSWLSSLLR